MICLILTSETSVTTARQLSFLLARHHIKAHLPADEPPVDLSKYFKELQGCDFVALLVSEHPMDALNESLLLYALLKGKPALIIPTSKNVLPVNSLPNELLKGRLSKLYPFTLLSLDDADVDTFIGGFKGESVNYQLTKHETGLIKGRLQQYFRSIPGELRMSEQNNDLIFS